MSQLCTDSGELREAEGGLGSWRALLLPLFFGSFSYLTMHKHRLQEFFDTCNIRFFSFPSFAVCLEKNVQRSFKVLIMESDSDGTTVISLSSLSRTGLFNTFLCDTIFMQLSSTPLKEPAVGLLSRTLFYLTVVVVVKSVTHPQQHPGRTYTADTCPLWRMLYMHSAASRRSCRTDVLHELNKTTTASC